MEAPLRLLRPKESSFLTVTASVMTDQKKVIKRKGMPFYKDPMSKGNLIILFQVQFPENNKIDKVEYKSLADIFNQSLNTEA